MWSDIMQLQGNVVSYIVFPELTNNHGHSLGHQNGVLEPYGHTGNMSIKDAIQPMCIPLENSLCGILSIAMLVLGHYHIAYMVIAYHFHVIILWQGLERSLIDSYHWWDRKPWDIFMLISGIMWKNCTSICTRLWDIKHFKGFERVVASPRRSHFQGSQQNKT